MGLIAILVVPFSMNASDIENSLLFTQQTNQEHTVSGVVTSADEGEQLPGVNITVKGTSIGTSTDVDGGFSLTAPSDSDTLVFSFVGFTRQEVPINGRSTINVQMSPQTLEGEELVVVGYGAQEAQDVTGSVSSVSSEALSEVPVSDPASALQGRAAGVMVSSTGNGTPGEGVVVRIRGRRSLTAGNDPLFVVDGIPYSGGLSDINTENIESMEVLKDASATAIYGSRGANGVVIITTKRGGNHETMVSYDGYYGMSVQLSNPDVFNAEEFADMKREAYRHSGEYDGDDTDIFQPPELESIENGNSYDYTDRVTDDFGYQQSHNITVQGGNQSTQFAISGNFFNEVGIIPGQSFDRYNLRVNLDHDISDRLHIGTSTLLARNVRKVGSNPFGTALSMNPLGNPYDEDGTLDFRPTNDGLIANPLNDLVPGKMLDDRNRIRIFSNIFAEYDISDNFSYRLNFGPDLSSYRRGIFQGTLTTARAEGTPYAEKEEELSFNYTLENILNYQQDFGNIHSIKATGLFSIQSSKFEEDIIAVSGLPYESQKYHNLGTGDQTENIESFLYEWSIMSFMGRINYQLNDRYLFTVSGRADGSSRLAEGNKWGIFPSAAIGWRITEEPFMENQDLFSNLKLRASYGVTGNTAIDPYQTRSLLAQTTYQFGEEAGFGYAPNQISNPELQWETSSQVNIGLDFGLWDSRVTGGIEVYETTTTDMLLERNLPITSGFGSVFQNIGETKNRGLEITLNTQNIVGTSRDDFTWSSDLTFGANDEEIVELFGDGEDDVGNQWFIGAPLTVFYDYEKIGIWQEDEASAADSYGQAPGDIKVRDQNEDGVINEQDRVIQGTNLPDWTAGFANHLSYKGIDFSVYLYASVGQTIDNSFERPNLIGRYNTADVDYWTPENPTNKHPRPESGIESPLYGSSRGYEDGSFLKIRNVRLGYNLPVSLTNQLGIRSLRIYANAETPLLFSKTGNIDPEQYDGVIEGEVPTTRLYTLGVNINF
ncbi:SusC/RagA family TonB-linked outer membrane protein [Fodinibius salsisoli]|uniref:TonB-dependent receptor n=1 Tax=Fodinibius salsisoli TaxID=2820877 RepID=A0ABT3PKU9_9BACT|nr:TonB-dependent receptor [Fodinibius salsisoli]MCW9706373.1 TonB-dependent receptor [Fodinibius salsisoli]